MADKNKRQIKIDYDEGMRRMGLAPAQDVKFSTFENLLDTEDFERFNESFMGAREKMVEILMDYRPAELKRRTLSAMIAYDSTKRLMDELMTRKYKMLEQLQASQA